jgi:hypothetical protein
MLLRNPHDPLAPSSAHDAMSPGGVSAPRSSVRCASLSTCCPARSDSLGPADAAVPLHPIHPAARSTFGGRSSQSPQSLPCLSPPCQGSGCRMFAVQHSLSEATWQELRPVSRETLRTPSITVGNPISLLRPGYYVKFMSSVAVGDPARLAVMGPLRARGELYAVGHAMSRCGRGQLQ